MTKIEKISRYLVFLLVFLIPTQLALHFWPDFSLVFGIRVDYLAPAIYLTDLIFLALILLNFKNFKSWFVKYKKAFFVILVLAIVNTLFSTNPILSALKWLRIFEYFAFGIFVYEERGRLGKENILKTLFYSGLFFGLIGFIQTLKGATIGGPLYLLGERHFTLSTPGIALIQIFGRDFLRAYSTFPHPNALAGFLSLILIILLENNWWHKTGFYKIGVLAVFVFLLATFSLSAFTAMFLVWAAKIFFGKKRVFPASRVLLFLTLVLSLLFPIFSPQIYSGVKNWGNTVTERVDFAFLAGKMISQRFLVGEGLNTFIVNIPKFKAVATYSWILQPVHNIFLLTFAETGVIGLIGLFILLHKLFGKKNLKLTLLLIFILMTGFLDHYWLTLQQNSMFMVLAIAFTL